MSHEAADWTEISLAIECGVLSEPAQNDYNGGVMVPSGCRATLDTGEVACLQCTVGIPYQQIPRCPLCGADFCTQRAAAAIRLDSVSVGLNVAPR